MTGLQESKYRDLYDRYKYDEITFSGTIQKSSGIIVREIYLMTEDSKWPCTIISASMTGIKVSANLSAEELPVIGGSASIQVHFSFMGMKPYFIPISFYVSYLLAEITNTSISGDDIHLLTMSAAEAPPDFLIRMLGELIGVQTLTTKRAENRITVNTTTADELGLKSTHCRLRIDENWHECSLGDLSFSGCQIILNFRNSAAKKKVLLEILFREPDTLFEIPGCVLRFKVMKESGDKAAAGIRFDEDKIPHEYTMRLHNLLD